MVNLVGKKNLKNFIGFLSIKMNRDIWLVDTFAVRPAGHPSKCFYCDQVLGQYHLKNCVIRSKTIVIKIEMELVVDMPEINDKDFIEFMYNGEGSYCQNNIIDLINETKERMNKCLCGFIDVSYVRDATEEDEETYQLFVNQLPS